jgi:bifunctional NMN adenylyltransferase/nudix hydrolase
MSNDLLVFPANPIDPTKFDVGVIIARFQVPCLTEAHEALIDYVSSRHKKVIILLGVSRVFYTKSNPLDYATREQMIKSLYPNLIVLPVIDLHSDVEWSKRVDEQINVGYGGKSALLYGSRDSFIPYYSGRYKVQELDTSIPEISGTKLRELVSSELRNSYDWRAGHIHALMAMRDVTWLTVDIVPISIDGKILLGKKPTENKLRFIGGFDDNVKDNNCEKAAMRELREEAGLKVDSQDLFYIGSSLIDDPRYKGTGSRIKTIFFGVIVMGDEVVGGDDDIEFVKWVDPNILIQDEVMEIHHPLLDLLNEKWGRVENEIVQAVVGLENIRLVNK